MVGVGVLYAAVGIVFAIPAGPVKVWRLAAWIVSGVAYAGHVVYERFRLGNSIFATALHAGLAAALGAFGLAVGANIYSLRFGSTNEHRHLLLLSLGLWPVITAVPAFLIALGAGWVFQRFFSNAKAE
jgi:hypothetical protein